MSVQPARQVAFTVIRAVSDVDAYANLLLPREIARAGLSAADAALATELCNGTLRGRGLYDAVLSQAASRPVDRIDPAVLDALRLSTHQLLAMRVAPHAAVNEGVELVRSVAGRGAVGFANAVLRAIGRADRAEWVRRAQAAARSDDERLAVESSHPVWVLRALRRALAAEGRAEELPALLEADNAAPSVTMVALPTLATVPPGSEPTVFSPFGFRWGGGDPERAVRESDGTIRVQDEGSQLAALALSRVGPSREGERWLDLCAGPGGKTALLAAEAIGRGARLEANEPVPARAALVRKALAPVPGEVVVTEEDGRTRAARAAGEYDRILVDAPCTGLGALRRRPEARWRKRPDDVAELSALQLELFLSAFEALREGGVLGYVTCSPHRAETAGVVAEGLRRLGARAEELDAREAIRAVSREPLDLPEPLDGAGHAQLWPHRHGTDAMFVALVRRRR